MENLERRVYIPGESAPYIIEAGANFTDAQILTVIRSQNPAIPTNMTLAWQEVNDATGHYYKTTVVPPAQTKGC